ncbi:unnamed protein product [Calypogeia fissa]
MGISSCSSSVVSTCENSCNAEPETLCRTEPIVLQVVHKRKERMTRRQTPFQRNENKSTTPDLHIPLIAHLPDDITIDHILTRVHWSLLNILTTLNLQWYDAIRSGTVHNARIRMQTTQTLIIISHLAPAPLNIGAPTTAISAYDPSMEQWHLLPPIPSPVPNNSLPQLRGVVCLKGRLYIVAGFEVMAPRPDQRNQFFVLDFGAAARRWNKCRCANNDSSASRRSYGAVSEVEEGKICVWGTVQI